MNQQIKSTILELIQSGQAHTQQEICEALAQKGLEVSQTKISRLLHKLGATKVKDSEGRLIYHLAQEHIAPQKNMLLAELVIDISMNQTLIVVFTQPGSASMISRLIDFHKNELGVLGTIAGDDTIFVAPKEARTLPQTVEALKRLIY